MLRRVILLLTVVCFTYGVMACPVRLEMGLNQSGHQLKDLKEFIYNLGQSGFATNDGEPRFRLIFQLLKRKDHAKTSKKFAWGSVSVYDQQGKLMAYSFKQGPASKNESKAYALESYDRVMNDLLGELPACF